MKAAIIMILVNDGDFREKPYVIGAVKFDADVTTVDEVKAVIDERWPLFQERQPSCDSEFIEYLCSAEYPMFVEAEVPDTHVVHA